MKAKPILLAVMASALGVGAMFFLTHDASVWDDPRYVPGTIYVSNEPATFAVMNIGAVTLAPYRCEEGRILVWRSNMLAACAADLTEPK